MYRHGQALSLRFPGMLSAHRDRNWDADSLQAILSTAQVRKKAYEAVLSEPQILIQHIENKYFY
jgi:hypothetical protein